MGWFLKIPWCCWLYFEKSTTCQTKNIIQNLNNAIIYIHTWYSIHIGIILDYFIKKKLLLVLSIQYIFNFLFRKINISNWNDLSQCQNTLFTQRSYIVLLQPNSKGPVLFKGRYDDPLGAAIDFTLDTERRLLKALGNKLKC